MLKLITILYTVAYLLEWEESIRTLVFNQDILIKVLLKTLYIV